MTYNNHYDAVKPGTRALGVADSYRREGSSTLAGAVVRPDRAVDGFVFGTCTVGGRDATDAVATLWSRLDRPDVRFVFLSGIAPAWYNLYDLPAIHDATDRPVLSVSFEETEGLEPALRAEFSGDDLEERLAVYDRQPPRRAVDLDGDTVFVRAVGVDDDRAADLVRGFTAEGGRPEPLRVAREAARAGDALRNDL